MSPYYNNPYGRRRPVPQQAQAVPMPEYQKVVKLVKKAESQIAALQTQLEQQSKAVAETEKQLQSKNEIIERQKEDLKKLDAELVFAQAALNQMDEEDAQDQQQGDEEAWAEKYARLQAEMENLRKRWEQRSIAETTEARHRILLDMLPLADHLEMALDHANGESSDASSGFVDNIRATQRAFLDTLKRYNVTPIEAKGEEFDPNLHEAVGQMVSEDVEEDHVADVTQTGYVEGDKLLRPARVIVSKGS